MKRKRMRIAVIIATFISAVAFMGFFSRGSATVKSQTGCPASGAAFKVDYFGFPLKDRWICEIDQKFYQGGMTTFYKAGSIPNAAVDAALGSAVVLLPALYLIKRASK